MQVNKKEKRLLCEDYCKQFEQLKDYTLAKKIYEENKDKFHSIEDARNIVRKLRGHHGEQHRERSSDKSLYKPLNYDTTNQKPEPINTGARILIFDLETAPAKGFIWNVWKQNIQPAQITNDWFLMSWAAKWLFEDKVYSSVLTPKEAKKQDDKRIVQSLWQLVNEADIIVAHNAQGFDVPRMNTRFLLNDLMPPSPYVVIDTLKHFQKNFAFLHNKLDYLNQKLGLRRKEETGGFELWKSCYDGDKEALQKMIDYNIGDIWALEDLYLVLRPWIRPHPNLALHILDETQNRCPTCGSTHLKEEGHYHTQANVYAALRCENCGASSRKRLSETNIKQRRNLVISTAR